MAIKIGETTVVDDSRNLNAGIGTFYDIDFPLIINTFSPSIGQINVGIDTNIILTFNQPVAIGTTGSITIREESASGVAIATIGVGSTSVTISGAQVTIDPPSNLSGLTTYYPVIDAGAFKNSFGNVSTALTTYNFRTTFPSVGSLYQGGYVICKSGGIAWIVAPSSSQVSRNWYSRGDANTTAQACTGATGWFVPLKGQLQNPAYNCRTYWDPDYDFYYWSNSDGGGPEAYTVLISPYANNTSSRNKTYTCRVRAFRCVSY